MSKKNLAIQSKIEAYLEKKPFGQYLIDYFDNLSDKDIRRAIVILARVYPDKTNISDEDFLFVIHFFSNKKYILQDSFSDFVRSINVLNFTERQKGILIDVIKNNIETLCEVCDFELDSLLANLFKPDELFNYIKMLSESNNIAVLQHVFNILKYESFSEGHVSDEQIEVLKQVVSQKI